jgi:hypothetical protein
MYRKESLSDTTNTYPAKSNPAVPSMFRTALSALIMPSWRLVWMLLASKCWPKNEIFSRLCHITTTLLVD